MKNLLQLAKELDFTQEHEYAGYILDSLVNGQRQQVRKLMKQIAPEDLKTVERQLLEISTPDQLRDICKTCNYSLKQFELIYLDNWTSVPDRY